MKLAFPIWWRNHYRLLGPVIDRALARGWDVECWHAANEDRKSRRRVRAEPPPAFRSGAPRLREYDGRDGLLRLVHEVRPDAVISLRPPDAQSASGARWIGLQYTLDIGHFVDAQGRTRFDAIGVHTDHWRDRTADAWDILEFNRARGEGGAPRTADRRAVDATMRRCGTVVGFPEMDSSTRSIPPTSASGSGSIPSGRWSCTARSRSAAIRSRGGRATSTARAGGGGSSAMPPGASRSTPPTSPSAGTTAAWCAPCARSVTPTAPPSW